MKIPKIKTINLSKEEYIMSFCRDMRIRNRKALYVSPVVHTYLGNLVRILNNSTYISISSLVNMILSHHIATYEPLLRKLREADKAARSNKEKATASEQPKKE